MAQRLARYRQLGAQVLLGLALGTMFFGFLDRQPYGLVYNTTASIPKGIYLTKRAVPGELAKGDIACFPYTAPEWAKPRNYFLEGRRLCKIVYGFPGEQVIVGDGSVRIGSPTAEPVAYLSPVDSKGRDLPQDALTSGTVPPGHFLLLAPRYRTSFDSRYLGYIPQVSVTTKAWPLVTF